MTRLPIQEPRPRDVTGRLLALAFTLIVALLGVVLSGMRADIHDLTIASRACAEANARIAAQAAALDAKVTDLQASVTTGGVASSVANAEARLNRLEGEITANRRTLTALVRELQPPAAAAASPLTQVP